MSRQRAEVSEQGAPLSTVRDKFYFCIANSYFVGLRVRIPPGKWMSVSCECCVLSGRGLYVVLVIRPTKCVRVIVNPR